MGGLRPRVAPIGFGAARPLTTVALGGHGSAHESWLAVCGPPHMSCCLRCGLSATLKRLDDGYCSDGCRLAAEADGAAGRSDAPGAAPGSVGGPDEPNGERE